MIVAAIWGPSSPYVSPLKWLVMITIFWGVLFADRWIDIFI
jgi:hypothetical protein